MPCHPIGERMVRNCSAVSEMMVLHESRDRYGRAGDDLSNDDEESAPRIEVTDKEGVQIYRSRREHQIYGGGLSLTGFCDGCTPCAVACKSCVTIAQPLA
jgi:hypothetical protein